MFDKFVLSVQQPEVLQLSSGSFNLLKYTAPLLGVTTPQSVLTTGELAGGGTVVGRVEECKEGEVSGVLVSVQKVWFYLF